jgi:hypothetical protein
MCVCVCVCVGAAPVDEAGCRRRPRTVRVGEWATGMKSDSVSAAASVFGSRNGSRVTRDTPDTVCGGLHKPGSETDYVLLGSCTQRSPSRGLPKHYPTATARYRTQESDPRWYRLTRSWRLRYFVHPCPRGLPWCGFNDMPIGCCATDVAPVVRERGAEMCRRENLRVGSLEGLRPKNSKNSFGFGQPSPP